MRIDEGVISGEVVEVWREDNRMWAKVSIRGVVIKALAQLVDDIRVGDKVLLHGKIILAKLGNEKNLTGKVG